MFSCPNPNPYPYPFTHFCTRLRRICTFALPSSDPPALEPSSYASSDPPSLCASVPLIRFLRFAAVPPRVT